MRDTVPCPKFPEIPGAARCSEGDSSTCPKLSICRMPTKYPRTLVEDAIQTAYTLSKVDFDNALKLMPDMYGLSTTSEEVTSLTSADQCAAAIADMVYYYSYIEPIKKQEEEATRETAWVLDETQRNCDKVYTGITKGPSFISLLHEAHDPSILTALLPDMISPFHVTQPMIKNVGTRIPKPKGDCYGTWNLRYIDGKLKWECDSSFSYGLCGSLTIDSVEILLSAEEAKGVTKITTDDIKANIQPYIRVQYSYTGNGMPEVPIEMTLVATKDADSDKQPCASVGWIYTGFPIQSTSIGPLEADDTGNNETQVVAEELFPFAWSAVECYIMGSGENATANYSDVTISCSVKVPKCPDIDPQFTEATVSCTHIENAELTIVATTVTDEHGFIYKDKMIGTRCNEVRSGLFYLNITYKNESEGLYISDKNQVGIIFEDDADDDWVDIEPGSPPDRLAPGASVTISHRFQFTLPEQVCGGSIGLIATAVTDEQITIGINNLCKKCPSYQVTDIQITDWDTGFAIDRWDVHCDTETLSRRVNVTVTVIPDTDGCAYSNRNNEILKLDVEAASGITAAFQGNQSTKSVRLPDYIAPGDSALMTFPYVIGVKDTLSPGKDPESPAGDVTFSVSSDKGGEEASLLIYKYCNNIAFVPGETRIYKKVGANWESVEYGINDCEAAAVYTLTMGWRIENKTEEVLTTTVAMEFTLEVTGALEIEGERKQEKLYTISKLMPGGQQYIYADGWDVVVHGGLKGTVIGRARIVAMGITSEAAIYINRDCVLPSSSSSSSDPCGGNAKCCPWLYTDDEKINIIRDVYDGRCKISLTDKAAYKAGSGISLTPDNKIVNLHTAGSGISLTPDNKIVNTAQGAIYTEGPGITITDTNVILLNTEYLNYLIDKRIALWMSNADNVTECK